MTWNPLTDPVDKFLLGGHMTPGIADVVGANSPRNWEERAGYGWSGAWLIYRGVGLSHFSIVFTLYTDADWLDWYAFQPLVTKPPYGKRPRALDIVHPLTSALGIRAVVVEDALAPEQSEPGVWVATLKVIEWRHPKYSLAKPEGSQAAPVDPIDQEILDNKDIIGELGALLARPAR